MNKHIVLGILAHVDAGKTTLSESLLYLSGRIRRQGRVDHQDAYLDTDKLEKERGITIFSKQAELTFGDLEVTLLDTPGHVDFSPEMERTLQVLDLAVLVISAGDGVTGQVRTLWKLLAHYQVPTVIFINKMDQPGADRLQLMADIQRSLSSACLDFAMDPADQEMQENLAVLDEALMEAYLDGTPVSDEDIRDLVAGRKLFPVWSGSALKNEGVERLIDGICRYVRVPQYGDAFGARVFKITRDDAGVRLTHMKITGGSLKVKSLIPGREENASGSDGQAERKDTGRGGRAAGQRKADQIRILSGSSFMPAQEVTAGCVCAVTGLEDTRAGEGLGFEETLENGILQPVFSRTVLLEEGIDRSAALRNLRLLEEEEPMLHIAVEESTGEITAQIMGQVQTEILREVLKDRFGMTVQFGPASIVYRETIAEPVEGVGHYEPLRHYAEVHLLLEPTGPGSGLTFETRCSTDQLARNWQRLVMTHLEERKHRGVLTGAEITDMRITLIAGRAHEKHTEGGDFRQATYRAVRQGLMMAKNILLEPVYEFRAEIPAESIGRLLSDIQRMEGSTDPVDGDGKTAVITGTVPAAALGDYQRELTAYTHGKGQMFCSLKSYEPCRHMEELILEKGYDPDADLEQPSSSVFCSHGAGLTVPWELVREYMHIDTGWRPGGVSEDGGDAGSWSYLDHYEEYFLGSGTDISRYDGSDGEAVQGYSSTWQKEKKVRPKSYEERARELSAADDELRSIFEKTYGGSRWRTPAVSNNAGEYAGGETFIRDPAVRERMDALKEKWEGRNSEAAASGSQSLKSAIETLKKNNAAEAAGTKTKGAFGRNGAGKNGGSPAGASGKPAKVKEEYLLVDGYNIIFAWEDLRALAAVNMDAARDKLMDILSDYHGTRAGTLILVFDAYKVRGGQRHVMQYHNIYVVFTKEAETADAYIEQTVHQIGHNGNITVATSDGLEQMIIFGEGARRVSAREFALDIKAAREQVSERIKEQRS